MLIYNQDTNYKYKNYITKRSINMSNYAYSMVNKYGKFIQMPKIKNTYPELKIANTLKSIGIYEDKENSEGIKFKMGFNFDETGYRQKKYDVAILKNNIPKLLIEYDGESHYDEEFYKNTGVRPERCTAHIVKSSIADAIKMAIANKYNVPCIRINHLHMPHLRDMLIAYITVIVNEADCLKKANKEIMMIDMLEYRNIAFS